ncbi:SNF2-related protein [Cupriavidus necator]
MDTKTALYEVLERHPLPFLLHDFQDENIQILAPFDRAGLYAEVGCGKTVMSTVLGLIWGSSRDATTIVVMPPILLSSWRRWLESVGNIGSVVVYKGSPKERKQLPIAHAQWILCSMQIFKNDFEYLRRTFVNRKLVGIVDEATSIKNIASDNHRKVMQFFDGHKLMLLTGTPLSTPGDAYAYIKLISPGVYRSKTQFENIHVEERDFFNNVVKWQHLDLMNQNLMLGAIRVLKEDVLSHLHSPVYTPIYYALDPDHLKLYNVLAEEQMLLLESGGKIDATSAPRLYTALQQIVVNWDYFSGDDNVRPAIFDLIDNTIEEIGLGKEGASKLLIFANYKLTNRKLVKYLAKYKPAVFYSEATPAAQARDVDRFLNDPQCLVAIANPLSAGMGLNFQGVSWEVLFVEEPIVPKDFHQAVGRVYRDGQKHVPTVRLAIAEGTIQHRLHANLLDKDALVNRVQRGFQDLREAIYGR